MKLEAEAERTKIETEKLSLNLELKPNKEDKSLNCGSWKWSMI